MNKINIFLKRNASTILSVLGAIGVVGTSLSTFYSTVKFVNKLRDVKEKKKVEPTRKDKIMMAVPLYIPPIIIGVLTIGCIFSANVLNKQQQAALTSAYAMLNNYHQKYRKKLMDLYGEEADTEVQKAIVREYCGYHQIGIDIPDEKVIFYDEISNRSIFCYEREIMDAEYHINRNFVMRGYASLNEFYEFLGLPQTDYGESVGWSIDDGYCWIDFEHRLISRDNGGTDIYSIDIVFPPHSEYMIGWQ